jgi:hypothetical protein
MRLCLFCEYLVYYVSMYTSMVSSRQISRVIVRHIPSFNTFLSLSLSDGARYHDLDRSAYGG